MGSWRPRFFVAALLICAGCGDGPSDPGSLPLTGTWQGTSTYFNAPFTIVLSQEGTRLSGTYKDTFDEGFIRGEVNGSQVSIGVDFGDTGLTLSGTRRSPRAIDGTLAGPVIGGAYPFQMTRGR